MKMKKISIIFVVLYIMFFIFYKLFKFEPFFPILLGFMILQNIIYIFVYTNENKK